MKTAYKNMRDFWLDVKNLENKRGVLEIGPDKISAAGVEMAVDDNGTLKYVFVATNSLGDSSFYFENNSKSGLGGMIGGHGNKDLQDAAAHLLVHASRLTGKMTALKVGEILPEPISHEDVCLFAVSKDKIFYVHVRHDQVCHPENPFYPMFAYSQQVIGHFRKEQENRPPAQA